MLSKACKAVPVLFYGKNILGKKYVLVDWICLWLLVIGSVIFLFSGRCDTRYGRSHTSWFGLGLLLLYAIFDGITTLLQEKLYKWYQASTYNQMLWVNLLSAIFCFLFSLISTRFPPAIDFTQRHPLFYADAGFMGLMSVFAQWNIQTIVQEFGPQIFLAFVNLRLTFSIIASDVVYGHASSVTQIVALSIVGFALVFRSLVSATAWLAEESQSEEAKDETAPLVPKTDEEAKEKPRRSPDAGCASWWFFRSSAEVKDRGPFVDPSSASIGV
jgi:adenosine 3'-phospho 5'-phosphosulfate transporter B2